MERPKNIESEETAGKIAPEEKKEPEPVEKVTFGKDPTEYPIYDARAFEGSPDPVGDSLRETFEKMEEIDRQKQNEPKEKGV